MSFTDKAAAIQHVESLMISTQHLPNNITYTTHFGEYDIYMSLQSRDFPTER